MKINLNLIPAKKKEEIQQDNQFRFVLKWEIELLVVVAIFLALLFSISYILKLNLFLISNNVGVSAGDSAQFKEIEKYDAELREMNIKIGEIEKINKGQLNWFGFFQKINMVVPDEIAINSLATKNYSISLAGTAETRDDLISFKDKLAQNECFSDISLPLSNLISKEDVAFQMDFKIKAECIK